MDDSKRINVTQRVGLIVPAMFVLGVLKLAGIIDVSWWVVLFPLWIWLAIIGAILIGALALSGISGVADLVSRYRQKKRLKKIFKRK